MEDKEIKFPDKIYRKILMLQFFHGELNRLFFKGKLESAIICPAIWLDEDDWPDGEVTASTYTETAVFFIQFNVIDLETSEDFDDDMFLITVLLHEMVHQYCREEGVEDIDHGSNFVRRAVRHGLTQSGYKLTEQAKEKISERLRLYNLINPIAWKIEDFEKHYKEIKEDILLW